MNTNSYRNDLLLSSGCKCRQMTKKRIFTKLCSSSLTTSYSYNNLMNVDFICHFSLFLFI